MVHPSPAPRRVSKPSWLDVRLVLGVVLVITSVLVGARVLAGARHTDKQVAVTRSLGAGTTLRADDVVLVDTQLPGSGRGAYLGSESDAIGKVLSRPLGKGELVPASALAAARPRTTVSVPFAADSAPTLARGERIVVWLSTPTCPSLVLLPDVTVQDVRAAGTGTFSSGGSGQDVALSVEATLADRVASALAIDDATIRAGVLTGAGAVAPTVPLPSLDGCSAPVPSTSP
jgi:hypothetical protein